MADKKILIRVAEILIDELKLEDVTPETFAPEVDLIDELGIDSMDLTTVVLVLQDEYGKHGMPHVFCDYKLTHYFLDTLSLARQGL